MDINKLRTIFHKKFLTARQAYESLRDSGFSYQQIAKIGNVSQRTAWERINDTYYRPRYKSRKLTEVEMNIAIKIAREPRGK